MINFEFTIQDPGVSLSVTQSVILLEFTIKIGQDGVSSLTQLAFLLNQFPTYLNDEDAIADGLAAGDPYWLSPGTDIGLQDTLKRVSTT